jgi:hypothetical protein
MRLSRLVCAGAALLFLAPTIAKAQEGQEGQEGHPHRGFWIGFGIGGGSAKTDGAEESLAGGVVYLRLGGTVGQKWLLGGEAMGWGRNQDGVSYGRGNTTFTAMFYPSQRGGLYLKGGVGVAYVDVSTELFGAGVSFSEAGFGSTFGLGWDIRLGNNIYLTPNLDWMFQSIQILESTQNTNLLVLTVGLIWH